MVKFSHKNKIKYINIYITVLEHIYHCGNLLIFDKRLELWLLEIVGWICYTLYFFSQWLFFFSQKENRVIGKVSLSLGLLAFIPSPLFQWDPQSTEILLNLSMKCWNSSFNAQGSRPIIVVVQVGIVKIYVAVAVEALRKKERQDET
jgi:CDP-diglyceride synthetase